MRESDVYDLEVEFEINFIRKKRNLLAFECLEGFELFFVELVLVKYFVIRLAGVCLIIYFKEGFNIV